MPRPWPAPRLDKITISDLHQAGACAEGVADARGALGLWDTAYFPTLVLMALREKFCDDETIGMARRVVLEAAGRADDPFIDALYGEHGLNQGGHGYGTAYGDFGILSGPFSSGYGDGQGGPLAYGHPLGRFVNGQPIGIGDGGHRYFDVLWSGGGKGNLDYDNPPPDWPGPVDYLTIPF